MDYIILSHNHFNNTDKFLLPILILKLEVPFKKLVMWGLSNTWKRKGSSPIPLCGDPRDRSIKAVHRSSYGHKLF